MRCRRMENSESTNSASAQTYRMADIVHEIEVHIVNDDRIIILLHETISIWRRNNSTIQQLRRRTSKKSTATERSGRKKEKNHNKIFSLVKFKVIVEKLRASQSYYFISFSVLFFHSSKKSRKIIFNCQCVQFSQLFVWIIWFSFGKHLNKIPKPSREHWVSTKYTRKKFRNRKQSNQLSKWTHRSSVSCGTLWLFHCILCWVIWLSDFINKIRIISRGEWISSRVLVRDTIILAT